MSHDAPWECYSGRWGEPLYDLEGLLESNRMIKGEMYDAWPLLHARQNEEIKRLLVMILEQIPTLWPPRERRRVTP